MSLTISQVNDLLAGRGNPRWIGNVPERVRSHLRCSTGAVYLSKDSAEHILVRHKDIDMYSLTRLPIVIDKGTAYAEKNKKRYVHFLMKEGIYTFHVTTKVANQGHELWICSMYPLRPSDVATKMKRYIQI